MEYAKTDWLSVCCIRELIQHFGRKQIYQKYNLSGFPWRQVILLNSRYLESPSTVYSKWEAINISLLNHLKENFKASPPFDCNFKNIAYDSPSRCTPGFPPLVLSFAVSTFVHLLMERDLCRFLSASDFLLHRWHCMLPIRTSWCSHHPRLKANKTDPSLKISRFN